MDGFLFFRRNVTIRLIIRSHETGKGIDKVRCEKSVFLSEKPYLKQVQRQFYYTNMNAFRNFTVSDPATGTPDVPSAEFLMQYTSKHLERGPYNTMKSVYMSGDVTYSLLSQHWEHIHTEENCTVVKVYPRAPNYNETSDFTENQRKYECQIWEVEYREHLKNVAADEKDNMQQQKIQDPPTNQCCIEEYKRHCTSLMLKVYNPQCYAV